MSDATYGQLLELAAAVSLAASIVMLWRRSLEAIVRTLAVQAAAIAATSLLIGLHDALVAEIVIAGIILAVKAVLIPWLLMRLLRTTTDQRVAEPALNTAASLVIAAVLALGAFAATTSLVQLAGGEEGRLLPVGFAIVLIAYFGLVTRRNALTQIVGFLQLENGIALVALLASTGGSLLVELGTALDLLLAVLVLQVLIVRMQSKLGGLDLDHLQELRD
jgi:hydrogenase-4 component E